MAAFLQLFVSGLATGAIYALVALGFTLLWQTSQTINFAQGEFVMIPAFFILAAMKFGGPRFWSARLVGLVVALLVLGLLFKRLIVDPMLRHGVLPLVISTIALSLFLREAAKDFYSAQAQPFPPLVPAHDIEVFGAVISTQSLVVLAVAVAAVAAVQFFLVAHAHRPLHAGDRAESARRAHSRHPRRAHDPLHVPHQCGAGDARLGADQPDLSRQVHQRRDARPRRLRRRDRRRVQPGARRDRRRAAFSASSTISRPPTSRRNIAARFRCCCSCSSSCSARTACSGGPRSARYERRLAARGCRRHRRGGARRGAVRPQAFRRLSHELLGGDHHRRARPQSDARLCRPDFARASWSGSSLAQGAFVGIGAYTVAIATAHAVPFAAAFVLAGALSFAIGWVLGYPALRVQHHYLAFVTLAFSTVAFLVMRNEEWLTGGVYGINGIARPASSTSARCANCSAGRTRRRAPPTSTSSASRCWRCFRRCCGGSSARPGAGPSSALRENPTRALSLGVDTRRYTLMAFAIGSCFGGCAGAVYAPLVQFIEPNSFALGLSLNLLLMVIVGGSGYFLGPFAGGLVAILAPEWLRFTEGYYLPRLRAPRDGADGDLPDRPDRPRRARRGGADASCAPLRARSAPRRRCHDCRPRGAGPAQDLRRHRRGRRRVLRRARERDSRHHRPERLGEVDAVQLRARPVPADRRPRVRRRPRDHGHAALRAQPSRRRAAPSSCCRCSRSSPPATISSSPARSIAARWPRACSGAATSASARPPTA